MDPSREIPIMFGHWRRLLDVYKRQLESNAKCVTESNRNRIRRILKDAVRVKTENDRNTTFAYTDPDGTLSLIHILKASWHP